MAPLLVAAEAVTGDETDHVAGRVQAAPLAPNLAGFGEREDLYQNEYRLVRAQARAGVRVREAFTSTSTTAQTEKRGARRHIADADVYCTVCMKTRQSETTLEARHMA